MNRRDFMSVAAVSLALAGCVEARIGGGSNENGPAISNRTFKIIDPKKVNERYPADPEKPPIVRFDTATKQVIVTGTLRTGGTCKTAALQSVTYEANGDSLVLTVTDVMKEGVKSCGAVAGAKSYRAVVEFAQKLPDRVTATEKDANGNVQRKTVNRTRGSNSHESTPTP